MKVFFSYSHLDETLRDELEKHLAILKREGDIEAWHDRRILAGSELDSEIDENLLSAGITLLLVSPNFLASEYCYSREMKTALERHATGETRVVPIILDHCDWLSTPLQKLKAIPRDGKPVVDYANQNLAFHEVTLEIRRIIDENKRQTEESTPVTRLPGDDEPVQVVSNPRSGNLRVPKSFSDFERDRFCRQAFEYMAKYFQNSLAELERRNDGLQIDFAQPDANSFVAKVYQNGEQAAACRIWHENSGFHKRQILFSYGDHDGSFNSSMSVTDDGYALHLNPMINLGGGEGPLSFEGSAEFYWSMLIEQIRRRR